MGKTKFGLVILAIILLSSTLTGCWNYREVDDLAIVAGVAIDKNIVNGKYELTVEIVDIPQGRDTQMSSKYITLSGNTIFDIARNIISISGKRLYWSHAKSIVVSKLVAEEGITKIVDWFSRDAETRTDMNIFISKEPTAKEVITAKPTLESVVSFELAQLLQSEKSISTAPIADLWKVIDNLMQEGISLSIPVVSIDKNIEGNTPRVDGMAIFKSDKLIGLIDGNTTKYLLFAKDEIKGGVLVLESEKSPSISLEIFENTTKIKPVLSNGIIKMEISTETIVSLDEIQTSENFFTEKDRSRIEERASLMLQASIYSSIKKIQRDYDSDILGFGVKIYEDMPEIWNEVSNNWNETFKTLDVSVYSKVKIKNSASTSKPIKIGD